MSQVINSEDIKVKVSGKFGSFFSKTNITIGVTDKFVYKEISKGKNSGTKIYPQTRIDSYGIEVSQSKIWLVLGMIFSIVLPISIYSNLIPLGLMTELIFIPIVIGVVFLIIWLLSRKLIFVVNTISKEKLKIELKTTNTNNVEDFIKFLNKSMTVY
jgi:hypothetical protein